MLYLIIHFGCDCDFGSECHIFRSLLLMQKSSKLEHISLESISILAQYLWVSPDVVFLVVVDPSMNEL
jgi:hypothetical protein